MEWYDYRREAINKEMRIAETALEAAKEEEKRFDREMKEMKQHNQATRQKLEEVGYEVEILFEDTLWCVRHIESQQSMLAAMAHNTNWGHARRLCLCCMTSNDIYMVGDEFLSWLRGQEKMPHVQSDLASSTYDKPKWKAMAKLVKSDQWPEELSLAYSILY